MTRPILFFAKSLVHDYDRHTHGGAVVHVPQHQDSRTPHQTVIPPGWERHDKSSTAGVHVYRKPLLATDPMRGRRKHAQVAHFQNDGTAHVTHSNGYISKHGSLDAAFDTAERTSFNSTGAAPNAAAPTPRPKPKPPGPIIDA
jgi:hypothetical protein